MPEIGRIFHQTPNANTSSSPTQNVGMLHSTREPNTVLESIFEPRRDAAVAPSTTPRMTTITVAAPTSRIVFTSRSPMMSLTGLR